MEDIAGASGSYGCLCTKGEVVVNYSENYNTEVCPFVMK